ncbi:integrin alpha-6-like [Anneissia japonica]|uniref:integrin alpha-6-like n=1 Tax=Anneissia japonica TaxID=1529436 RepID=UPI0014257BCB|nr:integrin alpha-6-like [Anneissia japonica]
MGHLSAIFRTIYICTSFCFCTWADGPSANRLELLEVRLPMVKVGPADSFFGFSVAEHRVIFNEGDQPVGATENVLLVGAPIYDSMKASDVQRPGEVFRCPISTNYSDCEPMEIDITGNSPMENKTDQWLGVTVRSQGPGGYVVTCAHRYRILQPDNKMWGLGKCYLIRQNVYDLSIVRKGRQDAWVFCDTLSMTQDNYGYCQAGTGLALTKIKESSDLLNQYKYLAAGLPGVDQFRGGVVVVDISESIFAYNSLTFNPQTQAGVFQQSYAGLSMSIGKFRKTPPGKDPNFFVAGAPRNGTKGAVTIFHLVDTVLAVYQVLSGETLTESFGYETCPVDLNGDGLDDLVVGAPLYYNRKERIGGRIYVYLNVEGYLGGTSRQYSEAINGPLDSMYGISMANLGDLNYDTFQDIAVGAPYENGEGAVYIYMGNADGILGSPVQKITPHSLNPDLKGAPFPNNTFGYSLSGGIDMDNNSFPDLLIGAFESSEVVLLRTRPVILIKHELNLVPDILVREDNTCPSLGLDRLCFTVEVRIWYECGGVYDEPVDVRFSLQAEKTRLDLGLSSRVSFYKKNGEENGSSLTKSVRLQRQNATVNRSFILVFKDNLIDILRPVPVEINIWLPESEPVMPEVGQPVPSLAAFPIMDLNTVTYTMKKADFKKDCTKDDGICTANLQVNATLDLPRGYDGVTVFRVGENFKINLNLQIKNTLEDAYEAMVKIDFTPVLEFDGDSQGICISTGTEKGSITCDLGNPFGYGEISRKIGFLGNQVVPDQGYLVFNVSAVTTSNETMPADNFQSLVARVESLTNLVISANTNLPQYQVGGQVIGESAIKDVSMIGTFVQHNWTIFNEGPGVVQQVQVNISFPYEARNGKWLLYLTNQPIITGMANGTCLLPLHSVDELNLTRKALPDTSLEDQTVDDFQPLVERRRKRDVVQEGPVSLQQSSTKKVTLECGSADATAKCFTITCYIGPLKGDSETKIILNSRLWNSTFIEDYKNVETVFIQYSGGVSISNGTYITQRSETDDGYTLKMEVKRDFDEVIRSKSIAWWIILCAVLGGVLLLIIIILLLWKCGFFERKTMNYKYASVEQKPSGKNGKTEKTYLQNNEFYAPS